MDPLGAAALASWNLNPLSIAFMAAVVFLYVRGWLRIRRQVRRHKDSERLTAFIAGMMLLFIATESPLDSFDGLFLSAHMTQHLLLMMFIPPLLLFGHPTLPLLRSLPRAFVKEVLGPFLWWPLLKRVSRLLLAPPMTWTLFVLSTIIWHLPTFYEAALSSPWVHGLQHASFFWTGILFWWPILRPVPGRSHWPEWIAIPYLLAADIVNTGLSAIFVFSGRVLYPSYGAIHASSFDPVVDQTLAGLIMWVPGSIVYLIPAFIFAMRLLSGPKLRNTSDRIQRIARIQTGKRPQALRLQSFRRPAQVVMLIVAGVVMVDGFAGPQVTPLNLAGILPWIHWRALSIIALLALGNVFCMACPFTFVRDIGRKFLWAKLRWPSALRTKWLAATLLFIYLWAYEAFGLWDSPWMTAWIIAGYFLAALIIDGIFRGASFCKYVCPIGQFHFVSSLVSPREVRVRSQQVCKTCKTHDCVRGNQQSRGCELYLFQPRKESNLDCTFCLDCVKACPTENVALLPVLPASTLIKDPYRSSVGRLSRRTDWAALALLIVFGAFVNAAAMTSPLMAWEHHWHARLGAGSMPGIIAAVILIGAVLLPLAVILGCRLLNRAITTSSKELMHRLAFALVPIGFSMWLAHLSYHLVTGWAAPVAALGHIASRAVLSPIAFLPSWLTSVQILMLDGGLLLTLYIAWRIAKQYAEGAPRALAVLAPWAVVACGLYAAGIWILFQPMQMRGMM